MRKIVAYESALHNDWYILFGALRIDEEKPLYVYWNFDYTQQPIGVAKNIEREDFDGVVEVSFDIEWYEDIPFDQHAKDFDKWYDLSFFGTGNMVTNFDGVNEIHESWVRALAVTPIPGIPHGM